VDCAAYWPDDTPDFFQAVGSTMESEFARYDAVLFFESAAVGGIHIEGGNPTRIETIEEAVALNATLQSLWSRHPGFVLVRHEDSFFRKMNRGLKALQDIVSRLDGRALPSRSEPQLPAALDAGSRSNRAGT
jgi:hypothetical protein